MGKNFVSWRRILVYVLIQGTVLCCVQCALFCPYWDFGAQDCPEACDRPAFVNVLPFPALRLDPVHTPLPLEHSHLWEQPPDPSPLLLKVLHCSIRPHLENNFQDKIIKNFKIEMGMHLASHGTLLSIGPCVTDDGTGDMPTKVALSLTSRELWVRLTSYCFP